MKRLFFLTLSIFVWSLGLDAHAISVSTFGSSSRIDPKQSTHVFVIGYAGGLADQLFKSAVARARRYRELYPNHQIVMIGPDKIDESLPSYDSYDDYRRVLQRLGLNLVSLDEQWLLDHRLMNLLKKFRSIQSLNVFSHSAAHLGVGLEDLPSSHAQKSSERFGFHTKELRTLRSRMAPGAYVILHGCNSGFVHAPEMARILNVPVAGSLTSTNVQELFSDQNWYFNDSGRFPPELRRASSNASSFSSGTYSCASGHCHRMRPEPYPYIGGWGRLTAGLPHYKFFCGTAVPSAGCKRAMALAMFGHPGVRADAAFSLAAFRENVKDFLCPDSLRTSSKLECFEKLEASLEDSSVTFSGMVSGRTLKCDFGDCDVKISCGRQCSLVHVGANPRPQTTQNEFRAYLEGFQLLQQ